jgi:tetratricopeptide (TPR) repeat protein
MKKILTQLALLVLTAATCHAANPGAFLVAEFAARQGDVRIAAAKMQEALSADPESTQLRGDAFILALLAGAPEAASLARTLPENPVAALMLATLSVHDGHFQSAELGFAELPHDALTDSLKPLMLAWVQEAQGYADRAMDTLQPALNGGRLGSIPLLHAALMADAAHRDGLAKRLYDDLAHAQSQPSLQFAQILASFQARSGDLAAATATMEAALHANPELGIAAPGLIAALGHPSVPTAAHCMAQAYVEVAASLHGQEGHDLASVLVQLALTLDPELTDAHLLASEIASGQHQMGLAARELEAVSPSDPLWPVVQLRLAAIYQRDGRGRLSIRSLSKLASSYPDRPEPLIQLGDSLSDQKDLPEAVSAYDRAIALMRHPNESDWVVFYARGSALERMHEWPRAEADMNRALELAPNQPYVLNFLGYSMADRNQNLPMAQEMIQKALSERPNDGAIVDSLGWVKLREGDTKEALRLLEKAAEMEPEDPSITGHLGDAYWTAGRRIEAEDQWRRALVLKPDPDDQARIEARLKATEK